MTDSIEPPRATTTGDTGGIFARLFSSAWYRADSGSTDPGSLVNAASSTGSSSPMSPASSSPSSPASSPSSPASSPSSPTSTPSSSPSSSLPVLTICILVVGTRGDVQPFAAIGQRLQADGHRVRLATHAIYRDYVVRDCGLEFYPLGGDPKELAAYMVKTGGLVIPMTLEGLAVDTPKNMRTIDAILHSTWPAVSAADPDDAAALPFRAHAIIANPVSYGHLHVAEKLGVPLHIMFPQPWVPTTQFPHPLANLAYDDVPKTRNHLSYHLFEALMWQGTEGMINRFREDVLGLRRLRVRAPSVLWDLHIPHSFLWSPALVPRPADWNPALYDVVGTVHDTTCGLYTPPLALEAFLDAGPPPIFVGFGSMVLPDPHATTRMIVAAATALHVRVLIQSGWSDMRDVATLSSDLVYFVGNCPHTWLFPKVAAVVHHGGAGTTAAGLVAGKPTLVVPFFGDQPFWGRAVVAAGVGAAPCPIAQLTTAILQDRFETLLSPEIRARAVALGRQMQAESGADGAVESFYAHLPVAAMRCTFTNAPATKWLARDKVPVCDACAHLFQTMASSSSPGAGQAVLEYHAVGYHLLGPLSALHGAAIGTTALAMEIGGAVAGIIAEPTKGFHEDGLVGAAKGAVRGLSNLVLRPLHGVVLLADHVVVGSGNLWRSRANQRSCGYDGREFWLRRRRRSIATPDDDGDGDSNNMEEATTSGRIVGVALTPDEKLAIQTTLRRLAVEFKAKSQDAPQVADKSHVDVVPICRPPSHTESALCTSVPPQSIHTIECSASGVLVVEYGDDDDDATSESSSDNDASSSSTTTTGQSIHRPVMTLSIVLLAIGCPAEVAMFAHVAAQLAIDGHRVRLAANPIFQALVSAPRNDEDTDRRVEFVPLAGNPTTVQAWMASMAASSSDEWTDTDAFFHSTWSAVSGNFTTDAIIAHPAVVVHVDLAERLGVPLHLCSAHPWSPTAAHPHLLVHGHAHHDDACVGSRQSYVAFDEFVTNALHRPLDAFRRHTLALPPRRRHHRRHHHKLPLWSEWQIPVSYFWDPELLPMPTDWDANHIQVAGFVSPPQASRPLGDHNNATYCPPTALAHFVHAGPVVAFVGLDAVDAATVQTVLAASSVRVVWRQAAPHAAAAVHIASSQLCVVDSTVPLAWLVACAHAVVHGAAPDIVHLLFQRPKPSLALPVTATEQFWAARLYEVRPATTLPPHVDAITDDNVLVLGKTIEALVDDLASPYEADNDPLNDISADTHDAVRRAVDWFYGHLPLEAMACDVLPNRVARVFDPRRQLKLSSDAALVASQLWPETDLAPYAPLHYKDHPTDDDRRPQPWTKAEYAKMVMAYHDQWHLFQSAAAPRVMTQPCERPVDVTAFWQSKQAAADARAALHVAYDRFVADHKLPAVLASLAAA
ncbi:Aste57867_18952 [Aphanomyces stellatus]|uniref:Aste57867_18952 protein n=1 Tax=Aphanomyces stellatus TaxID=120398 RepID=A0A485LD36_9STRA|nr:hypothetical protein As57867_018888 [Aphanomyces stellatus]VFT95682.1 Aste57867_18952 [Aphanomyces stellatus]